MRSSLAGAIDATRGLAAADAAAITSASQHAFVTGIHFAVTIGACLAATAAIVVWRFLPHEASYETAVEAAEHMAELGVGGTPPAFADESSTP